MRAVVVLLLMVGSGCDGGEPAQACRSDGDCGGLHCVAGLCVSFTTPGDAAVPDLGGGDLAGGD